MKKIKVFKSLLKERDWLEEMATQGWLLQNITFGIIYDFKAIEPCEKVYEVERFAISTNPTVSEFTARTNVISMAKEFGWELATHDEMLNYYFVKDKAGDETDEFYSNEEDRKARLEHFFIDITPGFWKADLALALLNVILLIFVNLVCYFHNKLTLGLALTCMMLGIYFINSVITNLHSLSSLKQGRKWRKELCMSRAEWEAYKKYSDEFSFSTLPKLRTYLEEKSKAGLVLTGCENNTFYFKNALQQYDYVFDTKKDLLSRLKKDNSPFIEENKDWLGASLKWYETSIAQAAKHNLTPISVVNKNILVYNRPHSEEPLPWENKHRHVWGPLPRKSIMIILIIFFLICLIFGFNLGREFGSMLKDTVSNL